MTTRPTYSTRSISPAEPGDLAAQGRVGEVEPPPSGARHDYDQAGVGVVAERVAQEGAGPLALGGGVGEPGRLQVALDVATDRDREEDEDADRREDELRVLPGQIGDSVHGAAEPYQNSKQML